MTRSVRFAAIALTLMTVSCAGRRDLGPMLGRRDEPVRLSVQNNRFEDAAIWANWRGGKRQRVGLATGATATTTFTFDWVSEVVTFEVDFIAADGYMVDPIEVWPGDHLDLVILGGK